MSTREIQGHLRELYGIEVSPDLVSAGTDAVLEEVAVWQARPLEPLYPLVFLDALRVKGKRALAAALRRAVLIGCPAWLLGDADFRCRP
jgi:transposase-like protein